MHEYFEVRKKNSEIIDYHGYRFIDTAYTHYAYDVDEIKIMEDINFCELGDSNGKDFDFCKLREVRDMLAKLKQYLLENHEVLAERPGWNAWKTPTPLEAEKVIDGILTKLSKYPGDLDVAIVDVVEF